MERRYFEDQEFYWTVPKTLLEGNTLFSDRVKYLSFQEVSDYAVRTDLSLSGWSRRLDHSYKSFVHCKLNSRIPIRIISNLDTITRCLFMHGNIWEQIS
jgi:hypothetical protein